MAPRPRQNLSCADWPFDAAQAKRRQAAVGLPVQVKVQLAEGQSMDLVLIPPGQFVMGDPDGFPDEYPQTVVAIDKPFYIGAFEVTNEQYAAFDPDHDSRYISVFNKDQSTPGEIANRPRQPVIRVSWRQAMAFCDWLSKKTGHKFGLPTEAQWEYTCRGGTATPLYYGSPDGDFSKFANLADQRVVSLCRGDSPKWIPHVETVNDGSIVTDHVGKYQPNAFGLYDVHGNVWEWTSTSYKPYPYSDNDGRNDLSQVWDKVVRGGSFYDRPQRARSAFRLAYRPYQRVFNVGFRVVCQPQ